MNSSKSIPLVPATPYLTLSGMEVLSLMARMKVSLREIKDAVQLFHTTDMKVIESYLAGRNSRKDR